jgi:type II secretory pathway pseudopilin PulG
MRSSLRSGERQGVSPPCNARSTRRADALPLALGLQTSQKSRRAFSLIEVIIATAILMGSAVVLARLAGMGRDQSQKARLYSEAQQLCEQTLNELLLGMRPMELVESMPLIPLPAPIEDTADDANAQDPFSSTERQDVEPTIDETNPEWRHSVRIEPLPAKPGMWALTVEVLQGDQTLPRPIRFSLTRWISGPPPEGAFDELMQGMEEPNSLQPDSTQPGGLL